MKLLDLLQNANRITANDYIKAIHDKYSAATVLHLDARISTLDEAIKVLTILWHDADYDCKEGFAEAKAILLEALAVEQKQKITDLQNKKALA